MTKHHDIVIRAGTIVDGRGGEPFVGDVATDDDIIVAVGWVDGEGREEINASGLLVTPGFVDVHTHYDAQVIWEPRLGMSSGHGVTTIVMGNCGVGFAPCRREDHDRLVELMEGVEDIPGVVMTAGLTWEWETYPEYLKAVESRPHDINIASYLPHSALRVYVMGERAAQGENATAEDLAEMAKLTKEAISAGAIGVSTSRTIFHRSSTGEVAPTVDAAEEELTVLAQAMQSDGRGLLQIANGYKEFTDIPGEFAMMKRVAKASGCPLSLPTVQMHNAPDQWREIVDLIEQANGEGLSVKGQAMPRGVGLLLGHELTIHPFFLCPSYQEIVDLPLAERVAIMRDPAFRARLTTEPPAAPTHPLYASIRKFDRMFEGGDPINYEPDVQDTIAARAARAGVTPEELAYDIMLERDGRAMIYLPSANYAKGNLDDAAAMVRHKDFVPGLGDAGAHCGLICDGSYSTFLLSHMTRDRKRGEKFTVAEAIKALSHDTAQMMGFHDRGVIAPGYRADLNVIDYGKLKLHAPQVIYDLPTGGRRLSQKADGYVATLVNGKVVYRNGEATGALPGQLVRGQQPVPGQIRSEAKTA